jgi:hypothetical protein
MSELWKKFQRSAPSLPKLPEKVVLPFVHIVWVDSCHSSGWTFVSAIKHPPQDLVQESCGFLLKETEYSYFIVQNKGMFPTDDDLAVDGTMEIPKVAVKLIAELTIKKKPKKQIDA